MGPVPIDAAEVSDQFSRNCFVVFEVTPSTCTFR
jgi:hypothetical protein